MTLTISANPNGVISKDMKVILTCTSSDPNSKISGWMKDGVLLVVSEPLGPILIENLTYEDAGFYVCFIAGDEVLDVSTPYELQIAGKFLTVTTYIRCVYVRPITINMHLNKPYSQLFVKHSKKIQNYTLTAKKLIRLNCTMEYTDCTFSLHIARSRI